MTIFKRIDIDLEKERARIKAHYNKRQRKALLTLCDLFEAGKWQECLDHVNDEKAFPYNEKGEYPEKEHIGLEIGDVLHQLSYENFYTKDALLSEAKKIIAKESLTKPETIVL